MSTTSPAAPAPGPMPAPAAAPAVAAVTIPGPMYLSFTDQVQQPISDLLLGICAELVRNRTPSLTIYMATPGGDVNVGVNLHNHLIGYPFKVTTHATGNVDSIGIMVFLAGKERIAAPSAKFVFHSIAAPVVAGGIDVQFTRNALAIIESEGRRLAGVVAAITKISPKDAEALYNSGTPVTMYADEALAKGIIHRIEEPRIPTGATYIHLKVPQINATAKP